jgi:hypothetical protein
MQMANQPALVECDARLSSLLGEKVVRLSSLSERVAPMLTPVPKPVLDYTIRYICLALAAVVVLPPGDCVSQLGSVCCPAGCRERRRGSVLTSTLRCLCGHWMSALLSLRKFLVIMSWMW